MNTATQQLALFEPQELPHMTTPAIHPVREVTWQAIGLTVHKVKFAVSKEYPGTWDILWAHGKINGREVRVTFPFKRVPSDFIVRRRFLFNAGNEQGVMVVPLGLTTNGVFSTKW